MGCNSSSQRSNYNDQVIVVQNQTYVCDIDWLIPYLPKCVNDIISNYIVTHVDTLMTFATNNNWLIAQSLRYCNTFNAAICQGNYRWVKQRHVNHLDTGYEFHVAMRLEHLRSILDSMLSLTTDVSNWFYELRIDISGKLTGIIFWPARHNSSRQYDFCVSCPTLHKRNNVHAVQNTIGHVSTNPYNQSTIPYSYENLRKICKMLELFDPNDQQLLMSVQNPRLTQSHVLITLAYCGNELNYKCY